MELYKCVQVLVFFKIIHAITAEIQCRTSENCICSTVLTNYEFQCPMEDPAIVMTVYPEPGVSVQCHQEINWDTANLPYAEIGNVTFTSFRTCPFFNTTFMSVMKKLGINNTKELKIDYSSDFEKITLTSDYFEDLNSLEKLTLNADGIQFIDDNAFKSLNKLIEIDLRLNKIQLGTNLFQYSSSLKLLDLSQNELSNLPRGLFQNLTELRVLYMWSNYLKRLNRTMFENLQNLQTLELRNNQLEDLPEDVFYDLTNLKKLSLGMNKLKSLPPNLFVKNGIIGLVSLQGNPHLTYLPNNFFSNLTKLENISLNNCKLNRLPKDIFRGSKHIRNIYLHRNEIEYLPEEILNDLIDLQNLDLSYNKLKELPDKIFTSLTELKSLNLQGNMLTSINKKLFSNLYSLETINLKHNKIRSIDLQSFQSMTELKHLLLGFNYLSLDENQIHISPFNYNVNLEKVDLSHNNISTITDDWRLSKTVLKELDLSYNQITYVEFANMMAVSRSLVIDLSHNKIATVDFRTAEVISIGQGNLDARSSNGANNVVYLNDNPIECDCRIYDFARYFERNIDPMVPTLVTVVADSLTCAAPNAFSGYSVKRLKAKMLTCRLEQLQDNSTCPENCECSVRLWDKAFIVDCINRNLTKVPEVVVPEHVVNQTIVYLQRNLLTSGPKPNMGYENVTKLYLSSNNINEIAWVPPKIELLNVDNNNISSISYNVLEMLNVSTLTNISLGKNPWSCDCSTVNFSQFLISQLTSKQIDANDIYCKSNGRLMVHLNANDLCPTYTALVLGTSITLALIALVVAILAALFYRNEQEIKVWLFAHNMCLWFVTEEEIDKDKLFDAFISYSHKDEDFVLTNLVPELEKGPHPYKLCLHIRDWVAGEFIPKQIARSVEDSRRTLVVLSSNFLQSVWGKMEFRTAHTQAMTEGRARVIVILYGDINVDDLDEELKAYIKTNTYVKWGDPWFWDKLKYALPHSRVKLTKRLQKNQNIMISLNDKLDLISAIPSTPNPGSTPPAINIDPLLLKNSPLNFKTSTALTPPAESGLNPLLITVNK